MKIYEADTSHINSRNRSALNKETSTNPSVLFSMIYILQPEAVFLTSLFEDLHWDKSVLSLSFEVLYNLKGRFRLQAILPLYHKRKSACLTDYTLFFFIRTSNFDAEAERSYMFWRFEAETFLKMFLKKTWWRWNFFGTL